MTGMHWCLPLTSLSRVTPTTIRVLHILKRFVLLLAFVRASLNLKLHILQREEAKIEAQESRITVLPNVVKSRYFGIPLKMFTSSSSPSPSGASEGNDTTHYKAFGSSGVLEVSVWEGNWVGARFGGWLCSKLRGQTGWGGGGEGGHRTGGPLTTASLLRLHTKVILPPQLSPLKSYKGPQITRKLSTFPQYK